MASKIYYIEFIATRKVRIGDVSKLLIVLIRSYKKDMIAFIYPFNLFESPFIISVGYNGI